MSDCCVKTASVSGKPLFETSSPKRIAEFEKVCLLTYQSAHTKLYGAGEYLNGQIISNHTDIKLPKRATAGSAGYDFYADKDYVIPPGGCCVITTGVCCRIADGWFLMLVPRSGMGFNYGIRLSNTAGVIDRDFVEGDTHGHILVKLVNHDHDETIHIYRGDRFCQGILLPCGITVSDDVTDERMGGCGSTGV